MAVPPPMALRVRFSPGVQCLHVALRGGFSSYSYFICSYFFVVCYHHITFSLKAPLLTLWGVCVWWCKRFCSGFLVNVANAESSVQEIGWYIQGRMIGRIKP